MKPPAIGALDDDRLRAQALVPVSRETQARFAVLVDELLRWQRIKNLVGSDTLAHVWTRHVADSAQLLAVAPTARRWLDLGSGAGFPGLVVAILLVEEGRGEVHLIEANARKCAFLRAAIRATGAPADVHEGRIEALAHHFIGGVDAVTARALAPLPRLLMWTQELLQASALGIFPKGRDFEAELTEASRAWVLNAELHPSRTNPDGRILVISDLRARVPT